MRNAVLPFISPSFDFGNTNYGVQIMANEINLHNNNIISGFCMDSNTNNNHQQILENYSFPFHSSLATDDQLLPSDFPSFGNIDHMISTHQHSSLIGKKVLAPQLEMDFPATRYSRKRPIEVTNENFPRCDIVELLSDEKNLGLNNKNKRTKVMRNNCDQDFREMSTLIQEHQLKMPVRKSQKVTDKITALQKLVSPYGKTDTASVLQEASIYIKLVQEQIQNLFRMLSSSYDSTRNPCFQETGERQLELRSKGICLVPISFTDKISLQEEQIYHNKYRRN